MNFTITTWESDDYVHPQECTATLTFSDAISPDLLKAIKDSRPSRTLTRRGEPTGRRLGIMQYAAVEYDQFVGNYALLDSRSIRVSFGRYYQGFYRYGSDLRDEFLRNVTELLVQMADSQPRTDADA